MKIIDTKISKRRKKVKKAKNSIYFSKIINKRGKIKVSKANT